MPTYKVKTSIEFPVTYLKLEREHNKYKTCYHSVLSFLLKSRKQRLYLKSGFRYETILEQAEKDGNQKRGKGGHNKYCTTFVFM